MDTFSPELTPDTPEIVRTLYGRPAIGAASALASWVATLEKMLREFSGIDLARQTKEVDAAFAAGRQAIEDVKASPDPRTERIAQLEADLARAYEKNTEAWGEVKAGQEREHGLRAALRLVETEAAGVWRWQGDGYDHPESLSCPVVMSADRLRSMLAEKERLNAAIAHERQRTAADDLARAAALRTAPPCPLFVPPAGAPVGVRALAILPVDEAADALAAWIMRNDARAKELQGELLSAGFRAGEGMTGILASAVDAVRALRELRVSVVREKSRRTLRQLAGDAFGAMLDALASLPALRSAGATPPVDRLPWSLDELVALFDAWYTAHDEARERLRSSPDEDDPHLARYHEGKAHACLHATDVVHRLRATGFRLLPPAFDAGPVFGVRLPSPLRADLATLRAHLSAGRETVPDLAIAVQWAIAATAARLCASARFESLADGADAVLGDAITMAARLALAPSMAEG